MVSQLNSADEGAALRSIDWRLLDRLVRIGASSVTTKRKMDGRSRQLPIASIGLLMRCEFPFIWAMSVSSSTDRSISGFAWRWMPIARRICVAVPASKICWSIVAPKVDNVLPRSGGEGHLAKRGVVVSEISISGGEIGLPPANLKE